MQDLLRSFPLSWIVIFFAVFVWSAIDPADGLIWFLEVFPAMVAALILFFTRKSFPLTPLLYLLILIHSVVLMVGGHYTYAEVPAFDWLAEWMGSERNDFDKLGHFLQGFVPALIAREILLRKEVINSQAWLNFICVNIALAISAFYELIEWWVALLSEQAAEAFLGTQGYVWDTQSDMGFALFGAICALVFLSKIHGNQLAAFK